MCIVEKRKHKLHWFVQLFKLVNGYEEKNYRRDENNRYIINHHF